MGRSLDELPPQTRALLTQIKTWVDTQCQQHGLAQQDYRFSRRDVREATGWGNTQVTVHCQRLEALEYLLVHRGRRGQTMEYELLYDQPTSVGKTLIGLIDSDRLGYDGNLSGQLSNLSGPNRPQVGG